ncbi:TauD/TfdA family dioxygenase [Actinoplanes subglobosus]|uniref:TauD/TfdA family dioxygenase n=1 Tax=Actinoplanes subglobosus TaxID=1547892 RepID=A0ABV8JE00_9ACTN
MTNLGPITLESGFPSIARPTGHTTPADLTNLGPAARSAIQELLDTTGAVSFRGFGIRTVDEFEAAAQSLLGRLAPYKGGDAPRRAEKGLIYNAAGPDKSRLLRAHNELSYAPWHPTTLCFGCARPADQGGATTLIDGHRVYSSLPHDIQDAFRTRGVTYIQHLPHTPTDPASGIKSWPETFETDVKDEVMRHCQANYTTATWTPLGLLTTHRTPATLDIGPAPRTTWFNQAHIWQDPTTTPDPTDMRLWQTRLGYGAIYGDGTPILATHLDTISATLEQCTIPVYWNSGDLLLVDNRAVMHGRTPYTGDRQVYVAFA